MNDIRQKYIDYQSKKLQEDLSSAIDILCDLNIELGVLDIIHLLDCILEIRTLKKVIIEFEKEGNLYD